MSRISLRVVAYFFGALALAIYGFIAYSVVFVVNAVAMTIALYVAISVVVGREFKKLLNVFIISFLVIITSELCFSYFQNFIAFCISLFVLLVMIRYSLIKDHDSGWFGALCTGLMTLIFLLLIEIILAIAQLFPLS